MSHVLFSFRIGIRRIGTPAIFTLVPCLQSLFPCLILTGTSGCYFRRPHSVRVPLFCRILEAFTSVIHLCPASIAAHRFEGQTDERMRPGSSRAHQRVWLTGSLQTRQVLNPIPSLTLQQNISMRGANSESFLCARHLSGCFSPEPHKTSTSAVASGVTLLSNVKNCRRPQNTVVSERSQSQEAIDCGISFI